MTGEHEKKDVKVPAVLTRAHASGALEGDPP